MVRLELTIPSLIVERPVISDQMRFLPPTGRTFQRNPGSTGSRIMWCLNERQNSEFEGLLVPQGWPEFGLRAWIVSAFGSPLIP